MSRKYKFRDARGVYFITFTVVAWVDVFTRNLYRDILISSFEFCTANKGLRIHAYVIMTNHVHMIISCENTHPSDVMRDMKKHTSTQLIKAIAGNPRESRKKWMLAVFNCAGEKKSNNVTYQFWQHDNHPIELFSERVFKQKLAYIHNNPVCAGIVRKAQDYVYSSAGAYAGTPGILEISMLD